MEQNPITTTVFRFVTVRPFSSASKAARTAREPIDWRNMRPNLPAPPSADDSAAATARRAQGAVYSSYVAAIAELHERAEREAARIVPPVSAEPNEKSAPTAWTDKLSTETLAVLEKLDLTEGYTPDFVASYLQKKAANLLGTLAADVKTSQSVVAVAGNLWVQENSDDKTANQPKSTARIIDTPIVATANPYVQPLGIADFRRVEQTLIGYELGEIAHIENVLIGEKKSRTTRHLLRLEEMTSSVSETESVKERDTQTTDRFELQKETEKQIQQESALHLGASIAASYGPVSATISADYSNTNSVQQSDREAVKYGKETTARALERLTERVRTERVSKRLEEWEDSTLHELHNKTDEHITGVYRWVDS